MADGPRFEYLEEIAGRPFTRRSLFKVIAAAGASTVAFKSAQGLAGAAEAGNSRYSRLGEFTAIPPSFDDILQVPDGFASQVVISWDDEFGKGMRYGFNNDYVSFHILEDGVPIELKRSAGYNYRQRTPVPEGVVWVNHEYPSPFFVGGWTSGQTKSAEQIAKEKYSVGGSVIHLKRGTGGVWRVDDKSKFSRRLTGDTPMIATSGPVAKAGAIPAEVPGTVGNCSGGTTWWGTVLTCEENVQSYPASPASEFNYAWGSDYSQPHWGWAVEVDPLEPNSKPVKHTGLGRFRHENVAFALTKDGRVVAYQGDDVVFGSLYKFVSSKKYRPNDRAYNKQLFTDGQLFVAAFEPNGYPATQGEGRWVPVPMTADALIDTFAWAEKNVPKEQAQLNRPEDVEVSPADGAVWMTLTNNSSARPPDTHGRIRRLIEKGHDAGASRFSWLDFAAGGPVSGFSSPDNLQFDTNYDLWMVTDISSASLGRSSAVVFHGNNGLFYIALDGVKKGGIYRFANIPREAEGTGPYFTPDGKSMFLSVQHPGEETPARGGKVGDPATYTSWWPGGSTTTPGSTPSTPKPSLVSIRRRDGK